MYDHHVHRYIDIVRSRLYNKIRYAKNKTKLNQDRKKYAIKKWADRADNPKNKSKL